MLNIRKKSLLLFLTISCIGIALIPMIIYTILSLFIFGKGIDAITKGNLVKAIEAVSASNEQAHEMMNIIENKIIVDSDFNQVPYEIRRELPKIIEKNKLYALKDKISQDGTKNFYCLVAMDIHDKRYYAYQNVPLNFAETFIKPPTIQTLCILIGTALLLLTFLLIFTKILIRKVLSPIYKLSNWANNLNSKNIYNDIPDMAYPELECVAKLIKRNLIKEYHHIKNEQIFWRFCSHELRTPISIIGIAIELLQKKVDEQSFNRVEFENILTRLRRASDSMSYLIETILWIGKPENRVGRSPTTPSLPHHRTSSSHTAVSFRCLP